MPFVAPAGEVLPVYLLPAPFSDETTLSARGLANYVYSLHLPLDAAVKLVTGMVADNTRSHQSMMCINSHPVSFATYSGPLWTQVMADAKSRGIPMWGVDRFDRFWQARRRTRLRPVPRDGAAQPIDALPEGLSALVPVDSGGTRVLHGRAHRQISPRR